MAFISAAMSPRDRSVSLQGESGNELAAAESVPLDLPATEPETRLLGVKQRNKMPAIKRNLPRRNNPSAWTEAFPPNRDLSRRAMTTLARE